MKPLFQLILLSCLVGSILSLNLASLWPWELKHLPTVSHVDLAQYTGNWYEIARLPQFFERNCECVTATYGFNEDGTISVKNQCRKGAPDGELKIAEAKAWPKDSTNSKLEVEFYWPFTGDYWILALDRDYKWALVGHPIRHALWILSRTPTLDKLLIEEIVDFATKLDFDTSKLIFPYQGPNCKYNI